MSFFSPAPPPFELEEWKRKPHLAPTEAAGAGLGRKRVRVADGGLLPLRLQAGRSTPAGRCWRSRPRRASEASATSGTGGRSRSSSRSSPSGRCSGSSSGSGAGSMPLSFRFIPPIGGPLYWLRPGTVRLPPWPDKVPFTAGTRRTPLDVALYAGGRRRRDLPAVRLRARRAGTGFAGRIAAVRHRRPAGPARPPRACATRSPSSAPGRRSTRPMLAVGLFSRRPVDRRLAVHLRLHLVGRRLLEAEPSLPLRRLDDDQQRAAGRAEVGQAQALAGLPGGHAALAAVGRPRPLRHRAGVRLAAVTAHRRQRRRPHDRDRRHDPLPPQHHLDVPAGGAAGVEHLHDLRHPLPLRPLRGRAALARSTTRC